MLFASFPPSLTSVEFSGSKNDVPELVELIKKALANIPHNESLLKCSLLVPRNCPIKFGGEVIARNNQWKKEQRFKMTKVALPQKASED